MLVSSYFFFYAPCSADNKYANLNKLSEQCIISSYLTKGIN